MEIISNVLSEETLSACIDHVNSTLRDNRWAVSTFMWDPYILTGAMAGTITQHIEGDLKETLVKELTPHFGDPDKLVLQFYMWPPGAGIAWHNDKTPTRRGAGTIYLNDEWHPNMGGLFVWEEKDTNLMRALCPQKNTMVLNKDYELHMVTLVTPAAPRARLTIQVWEQG
jgi:Rps23 Pro-64 3,4-dihydroxylase Tpa1-like proline 4-hydroxylase